MRRSAILISAAIVGACALFVLTRQASDMAMVPVEECPAQVLGNRLGVHRLMFGAQVEDHTAQRVPFVARYRYLAGPVPSPGCTSCKTCDIDGISCENPDGCGWWGCWQDDSVAPGRIASDFVRGPQQASILTYYTWLAISGGVEGQAEVDALSDPDRVSRWLSDFRFLAQTIADSGAVVVHVEPDLLGFVQKSSADPTHIPVDLSKVHECSELAANASSIVPCWRTLLSSHAPDALLGVHVSAWSAGVDLMRTSQHVDVQQHADDTAAFLRAASLDADVLFVEASDRDAGFDGDLWSGRQPSFERAVQWAGALTQATGLPHLWWQVPMGTPGLQNTCGQYMDNRVVQFVEHRQAVARAGAIGVVFGAGAECMTTAESDDGAFLAAIAPGLTNPPVLCGERR